MKTIKRSLAAIAISAAALAGCQEIQIENDYTPKKYYASMEEFQPDTKVYMLSVSFWSGKRGRENDVWADYAMTLYCWYYHESNLSDEYFGSGVLGGLHAITYIRAVKD